MIVLFAVKIFIRVPSKERDERSKFTNRKIYQEDKDNWYHFDQSSFKKGFHCVQGFINLYDVNKGDSTLSVYEKSHLLHDKFFKHYNKTVVKDWYKLEKDELNFFKD